MTALSLARELLAQARPRPLRGIGQFAEEEIIVPDGPRKGERFRLSTQPVCRLLYAEIQSGRWARYAITAPSQSGKTLMGWVIPALWAIFELGETIIVAAPEVQQAQEKWRIDLEPAIRASRYREFLPDAGPGARGGETALIQFGNGTALRFMAGSGDDKSRAAFTARGLFMTETDGMDEAREGSREADPITQLEQRTKAHGNRAIVVMECTPSIKSGRIWREYENGSASRIVSTCPKCGVWVAPERDHLVGWKGAESERQAENESHWTCPACAGRIDERDRRGMVEASKLLHKGQEIAADGTITGPAPGSRTLGFRWSAFHNLMSAPGELGAREWVVSRMEEEKRETEERGIRQFNYATPAELPGEKSIAAREIQILDRIDRTLPRGVIPDWTTDLVLGVDVGERVLHWTLAAWTKTARGHIADYGIIDNPDGIPVERSILVGLRMMRDRALKGWPWKGGVRKADLILVDSGDNTQTVYGFAQEQASLGYCWPTKGRGLGQYAGRQRAGLKSTGSEAMRGGIGWHEAKLAKSAVRLIEFDTDIQKSWLAARTDSPMGGSGALTLFDADARTHHAFAAHLRAWRRVSVFQPGKGMVVQWQARRQSDHWADSTVLACLGAALRVCTPLAVAAKARPEAPAQDAPQAPHVPRPDKPPPKRPANPPPRQIPRPFGGSLL